MKDKIKTKLSDDICHKFMQGACIHCLAIMYELQPVTVERIIREWCKR